MTLLQSLRFIYRSPVYNSKLTSQMAKTCSIISTRSSSTDGNAEKDDDDMFISDMQNPFEQKKRMCILCKYKIPLDYKNPRLLSQFISSYTGFMYDKHITGLCDKQQKRLKAMIYTARRLGYMVERQKPAKYLKDPKLFDPFSPSRPNPH